ncbi:hypothetical protein SAMN05444358_101925 [Ruegeria halocynthiae]|uniref:Uncharacterized protein n=1 Tax=Ruegeria halocynthiae TaxID=985054 RepID=A0A1H2TUA3_9RHOB|nr:hypothetical protein SAMN05444358_101925 [Ruegeria halocynthiae]
MQATQSKIRAYKSGIVAAVRRLTAFVLAGGDQIIPVFNKEFS